MYISATRGRIFKTITKATLDDAMKEDVHGSGNGSFFLLFYLLFVPQLFLNSEYRECEQRTYIVKEHYDWLKSSASLITLKKHVIFFPNSVLARNRL